MHHGITQEHCFGGVGPEALSNRAEYKTEPGSIKIKDLMRLFTENYLPKHNTYHNCGDFFWAKQTEEESPEKFWRRLIETEKESYGSMHFHVLPCTVESYNPMRGNAWKVCRSFFHARNCMESYGSYASMH